MLSYAVVNSYNCNLSTKQNRTTSTVEDDKLITSTNQILTIHRKSNYNLYILFYKCY